MPEYQLGDRVTMTGTVEKVHVDEWTRYLESPLVPDWRAQGRPPYSTGIVIGQRTLQEGTTDWFEGVADFRPKHARVAYLVAFDLYRKPCMCLPEQLTREDH